MKSPTERPKKKSLGSACYSRARRDRRRSQWDKLQLKASSRAERERSLRIYAKGDAVGVYKLGRILSHWSKFTGANLSKKKALRKYFPCETILVKIKTLTENGVHLSRISGNKIQSNCGKWRSPVENFGKKDTIELRKILHVTLQDCPLG